MSPSQIHRHGWDNITALSREADGKTKNKTKTRKASIDSAAFWFMALERCCQQQLMIEQTGIKPTFVPEESARYSREHVGSDYIGWLHFQTIWNQLAVDQPDMFD